MSSSLSTETLVDQLARDQFTTQLDENFCVSASAGAGKTTAIVERIAQLSLRSLDRMRSGEPDDTLPRLVVVTYTKLAAEELRVRARNRLFELAHEQLGGATGGGVSSQRILAEFGRAYFGTIHSFCLKLLREEGRFLGLPGRIELLEDGDELWQRFKQSDRTLSTNLPEAALRCVLRHYTFDQLLCLAEKLRPDEAESLLNLPFDLQAPDFDFTQAMEASGKGRAAESTVENQKLLEQWEIDFRNAVPFQKILKFTRGAASFKSAYKSAMKPYLDWLNQQAIQLAAILTLQYRDFRLSEGYMTYDDMVVSAKSLIEGEQSRERLRRSRYIVLLDEAQDTDHNMFMILTELTRPVGAKPFAWPEDDSSDGPEAGRFCFVGDDQQSIYSQRASLSMYKRYVDAYGSGFGGRLVDFSVTMRCPHAVIGLVNDLFPKRLDQQHVKFRKLDARPGAADGKVQRLRLSKEEGAKGSVEEFFLAEVEEIAQQLKTLGKEGLGVSRWADVAILAPRVKWLSLVGEVFTKHGLPARQLSSNVRQTDLAAYSWPAALLYTVTHPDDDFERLGVLRELYGVSDVDLAKAKMLQQLSLHHSDKVEFSPRLKEGLQNLAEIQRGIFKMRDKKEASLSRIVSWVLEYSCVEQRIMALQEDSQVAAAIDALKYRAMEAESKGKRLEDFVESLIFDLKQPPPHYASGKDEIVLLTNYKSKGLEWPVVIPLGLGRGIGDISPSYPSVERDGKKVRALFSDINSNEDSKNRLANAKHEEYQRLFYVTLTRARRMLLLPDSHTFYSGRGVYMTDLMDWESVDKVIPPAEEQWNPVEVDLPPSEVNGSEDIVISDELLDLAKASAFSGPIRKLPHELAHDRAPRTDTLESMTFAGTGGIDYGLWWHGVMEEFPWGQDGLFAEPFIAQVLSDLKHDLPYVNRAHDEIEIFRKAGVAGELAAKGERFLAEVPFSHPLNAKEWMEGIIDLVVVLKSTKGKAKELWVVDWKTNRMAAGELEKDFTQRLRETYQPQLVAYGEALENGLGMSVTRRSLYSTSTGKWIDV